MVTNEINSQIKFDFKYPCVIIWLIIDSVLFFYQAKNNLLRPTTELLRLRVSNKITKPALNFILVFNPLFNS